MLADDDELRPARPRRGRSRRCARPRARRGRSGRGGRWRCAACAGTSCCASPSPTCSADSTSVECREAISATTEATLEVALQIALRAVAAERGLRRAAAAVRDHRDGPAGRLRRSGYGSDADVMFVFEPRRRRRATDVAAHRAGRRRQAARAAVARRRRPTRRWASTPTCARRAATARWCARWRPTRSTTQRWSSPWEAQALLRARFAAGDAELGERFIELIDPVRYPGRRAAPRTTCSRSGGSRRGSTPSGCRAAPTRPRTPSSAAGGLADIEWTVQLLQLQHAGRDRRRCAPPARSTRSTPRSTPACSTGRQAAALATAWRLATRLRNAIMLVRDQADDQLPAAGHGAGRASGGRWATRPGSTPAS